MRRITIEVDTSPRGERFGAWVVLGMAPWVRGRERWRMRCDCGRECSIESEAIKSGRMRRCGACHKRGRHMATREGASHGE